MRKVTFRELVRIGKSTLSRTSRNHEARSAPIACSTRWGRPLRTVFETLQAWGVRFLLQNLLQCLNTVKFMLHQESFRGIVFWRRYWSRLLLRPAVWEPMLCQPFGTLAWPSHHSVRASPARAKEAHSKVASPPRFLGSVARKRDWPVLFLTTVFSSPSPLRQRWARRLA